MSTRLTQEIRWCVASALVHLLAASISAGAGEKTEPVPPRPSTDLTTYINQPKGNVFHGTCEPFGMMKVGSVEQGAGKQKFTGFSHMALSGWPPGARCGAGPTYNSSFGHYNYVIIQPWTGELPKELKSLEATHQPSPQWNDTSLLVTEILPSKIQVKATATARCAIYRFTFPAGERAQCLIDARYRPVQRDLVKASLLFDGDRELTGLVRTKGGWGYSPEEKGGYFVMRTDTRPAAHGAWGTEKSGALTAGLAEPGKDAGRRYLDFGKQAAARTVCVKLGMSHRSVEMARKYLDAEIPDWDLEKVERQCRSKWNEVLGSILIEGATEAQKSAFYGTWRNVLLNPVDKTGDHPSGDDDVWFDDFAVGYDITWWKYPMLMLAMPEWSGRSIRGMLTNTKYTTKGFLSDGWISGLPTYEIQGGPTLEITVADAILKELPNFDAKEAYKTLLFDATTDSAPVLGGGFGRGPATENLKNGYLNESYVGWRGSGNVCLKVADYSVALAARKMGDEANYRRFLEASRGWRKMFRTDATPAMVFRNDKRAESTQDPSWRGYLWPKDKDGVWVENPFSRPSWHEGDMLNWTWHLCHDFPGLAEAMGGVETALKRHVCHSNPGMENLLVQFLGPVWMGRPDVTAKYLGGGKSGMPHSPGRDDDNGGSSGYAVMAATGFCPVPGQDVYVIASPSYPKITFRGVPGKSIVIEAENVRVDPRKPNQYADYLPQYVQSATLNGKPLTRAWVRHAELKDGAVIRVVLGPNPSDWGTKEIPPSASQPK